MTKMEIDYEYLNLEEVLQRIGGDQSVLKMMLGLFLESAEVARLEQSLKEKDHAAAQELSHGIKGMAGNLSLTALYQISTLLNNELKDGTFNTATVDQYFEILENTRSVVIAVCETL